MAPLPYSPILLFFGNVLRLKQTTGTYLCGSYCNRIDGTHKQSEKIVSVVRDYRKTTTINRFRRKKYMCKIYNSKRKASSVTEKRERCIITPSLRVGFFVRTLLYLVLAVVLESSVAVVCHFPGTHWNKI